MRKFSHSLLLYRINPNKDIVSCYFIFNIGWFTFKTLKTSFDLKEVPLKIVIEFYKNLSDEWSSLYRI